MDYQRLIDRTDEEIVERPGRIILVFLVATGVFAVGLGNISTEAGTQQFTTGLPAEQALEDVQREFSPRFGTDTGSTQLIQSEQNVLSKPSMLRMLRAQEALEERDGLRVTGTASAAGIVAQRVDPTARTLEDQIDALESATPSEIDAAVRASARENPRFTGLLSKDFNRESASASATIGTVTHQVPGGVSQGSGQGGTSPLTPLQTEAQHVIAPIGGNIEVFGNGLFAQEFSWVILDSLLIVVPAAVVLITLFLVVAYRDPVDLLLGVGSLGMTIVWTFGFMGLAGIPFSQMLIAVPPLLLAVGIDFGIHAINRYREEREQDRAIGESMRITTDQLLVAFFIVTGTTVIGFAANFASELAPIKDFGLVAAIGIVFTFLVFGIFLPAAKVKTDYVRQRYPIPTISDRPLGSEGSFLGRVLQGGVVVSRYAPVLFLLVLLLGSASAGYYARDIDTSFTQEDFLPPEETSEFLLSLPEPFRPHDYTVTAQLNFLEEKFASTQSDQVTIYVEGPLARDNALEAIHRASENPPSTIVEDGRVADGQSVISVIDSYAAQNPEFRRLVERNDRNDNGIPDDNLDEVYDALLSSPVRDQALNYITADRRSARIVYSVEAGSEQSAVVADAQFVADRYRDDATATGQVVVFQVISDLILESALVSLGIALAGASVFLVIVYRIFEGYASLGVANVVPILVTVALVAGSMRFLGIAFNAITATILAITIGLGIDYSVHVTHRFADEREHHDLMTALERTVRGTGGALFGSMLTTVSGIGVLSLAVFPAIGQFGVLTGLSVFYAFMASVVALPSTLVVWDRIVNQSGPVTRLFGPVRASPTATAEVAAPGAATPDTTVFDDEATTADVETPDTTSSDGPSDTTTSDDTLPDDDSDDDAESTVD